MRVQIRQHGRAIPNKLNLDQKHEMANHTCEELVAEASVNERRCERLSNALRAVIQETDLRIAELKKDAFEFKRDIVMGAENMRSGKTVAEKLSRHMEDKVRQRDVLVEKLRLKNTSINAQIQKIETQLKLKEEMGDVLHYIDFHQLQIENKQCLSRIEERNAELLSLKKNGGKTSRRLNRFRSKLYCSLVDSSSLQRAIMLHRDVSLKADMNDSAVYNEMITHFCTQTRLQQQQHEMPKVSSILDYISGKVHCHRSFVLLHCSVISRCYSIFSGKGL